VKKINFFYSFLYKHLSTSPAKKIPDFRIKCASLCKSGYLVQHGKAAAEDVDPARTLTEEGRTEVEKVAAFIEPLNICVDCVWHSGKTRAVQTAEILARILKTEKGLVQHDRLAPNDDVGKLKNELDSLAGDVLIVGHLPFLSKLVALLISGNESAGSVAFKNAGIVCISRGLPRRGAGTAGDDNRWQVAWIITPELLI
jgi:phosphohistidine phosphatase